MADVGLSACPSYKIIRVATGIIPNKFLFVIILVATNQLQPARIVRLLLVVMQWLPRVI